MGRREYDHDPDAPTPNSIVVAAVAFVQDPAGRVLLVKRTDNSRWALPGGVQEIGESVAQTAERETLEETGYEVKVVELLGVYSDPGHIISYDDGEVRQEFALLLRAELVGGNPQISPESTRVEWFSPNGVQGLDMTPSTRLRIEHGRTLRSGAYVG